MTATGARIGADALQDWVRRVFERTGVAAHQAEVAADVLVAADLRGIDSHGVARLPAYTTMLQGGFVETEVEPEVARRDSATALVDGKNTLGLYTGVVAMQTACELARDHGVGWVVAQRSNHYGIAGYHALLAADEGYVGMSGTNAPALVAPTRARAPFLGTNPIAFAAPVDGAASICLDMATSAASGGKFEIALRTGSPIPRGWGVDAGGEHAEDPSRVWRAGGWLLPLGSFEELGSYKGYGLALMVEILCAAFAGGPFGADVGGLTSKDPDRPAGTSHFFVAVDVDRFSGRDVFADVVRRMVAEIRDLPRERDDAPVLLPGEPEVRCHDERSVEGIPLEPSVRDNLVGLGADLDVPFPDGG